MSPQTSTHSLGLGDGVHILLTSAAKPGMQGERYQGTVVRRVATPTQLLVDPAGTLPNWLPIDFTIGWHYEKAWVEAVASLTGADSVTGLWRLELIGPPTQRRSSQRAAADINAQIRTPDNNIRTVKIVDLSHGGIRATAVSVRPWIPDQPIVALLSIGPKGAVMEFPASVVGARDVGDDQWEITVKFDEAAPHAEAVHNLLLESQRAKMHGRYDEIFEAKRVR